MFDNYFKQSSLDLEFLKESRGAPMVKALPEEELAAAIAQEEESHLGGRYYEDELKPRLAEKYPEAKKKVINMAASILSREASEDIFRTASTLRLKKESLPKYFNKIASSKNELVCKATRDFWAVEEQDGQQVIISRVDGLQTEEH